MMMVVINASSRGRTGRLILLSCTVALCSVLLQAPTADAFVETRLSIAGTQQRVSLISPNNAAPPPGQKGVPLVVQLNGFCENAVPTAPLQVDYKPLVDKHGFALMQLNPPKRATSCQLCPLTIRLADPLGLWVYSSLARLTQTTAFLGGCNAWNATTACCLDTKRAGSDVAFIKAAIDQAVAALPAGTIDRQRVFVVGVASGGFMALRLACDHPELVRGVVTYAGASELDFAAKCPSPPAGVAPPPMLFIHGTNDVVIPTDGDMNNTKPMERFPSADMTLLNFVKRNGCGQSLADGSWGSFRLDAPNRASFDTRGSPYNFRGYYNVRDSEYLGCANKVESWRVEGANHFMDGAASQTMFRKALEEFLLPIGR